MSVEAAIGALSETEIDAIRVECQTTGKNFQTLTVSRALNKPYEDVTVEERQAAHELLFTYLHSGRFPVQTYQVTLNSRTFWMGFEETRRALQNGFTLGDRIRDPSGVTRDLTDQERQDLSSQ
jgi:hypothetical protein